MKNEIDKFLEKYPWLSRENRRLEQLYRTAESIGRKKGAEDTEIFLFEGVWVRVFWVLFLGFSVGIIIGWMVF